MAGYTRPQNPYGRLSMSMSPDEQAQYQREQELAGLQNSGSGYVAPPSQLPPGVLKGGGSSYDPFGFAGAPPEYVSGWSPGMSLSRKLETKLSGLNADKRGINQFREEALRKGPSAWSNLARGQQDFQSRMAKSDLSGAAGGAQAGAFSQLAMRGGLDSGARERIADNTKNAVLEQRQKIAGQRMGNELQIAMNDEQNRISQLGSLPGLENTSLQTDLDKLKLEGQANQIDTANQLNESNRRNEFNLGRYDSQMKGWAANQQANATAAAGKK